MKENNNGWIKIESEKDLPKENKECFFIVGERVYIGNYKVDRSVFCIYDNLGAQYNVTHYQPIEKPKLPIEDYNRLRKLEIKQKIKRLKKEYKSL